MDFNSKLPPADTSPVDLEARKPGRGGPSAEQARGIKRAELIPLLLIVAASLVIGALTVGDYGQTWDESVHFASADYVINAYQFFFHPSQLPADTTGQGTYGPVYYVIVRLAARVLQWLHPAWVDPIAWHFCYFVTFLGSIVVLYLFLTRWVSSVAAFGTCLVVLSQPLLLGHAFINPKDLAFMGFFLTSVLLGLEMVDNNLNEHRNNLLVVCAAVMLGLTTSFRIAGPLAGVLVAVYAIWKAPRKSIGLLLMYASLAVLVSYLTWPFLWVSPISKLLESMRTMAAFPYQTKNLFMGQYYTPRELPWFFFPVLLGIQLTLPLVLMALAGLAFALRGLLQPGGKGRGPLLLFVGWFLLPFAAVLAAGSVLYDNARQLYFILPPIFLLAAVALDMLLPFLRKRLFQYAAIALLVLPGIYGIIRLYPYEYTYYNQLVGGTGGAYGRYEMDYWGSSYRESALWLNQHAAPDSRLWVTGPSQLLKQYLRPDLVIACASDVNCGGQYDYLVALARWKAERDCPKADIVYEVQRRGAIFTVVKQLAPGERCE